MCSLYILMILNSNNWIFLYFCLPGPGPGTLASVLFAVRVCYLRSNAIHKMFEPHGALWSSLKSMGMSKIYQKIYQNHIRRIYKKWPDIKEIYKTLSCSRPDQSSAQARGRAWASPVLFHLVDLGYIWICISFFVGIQNGSCKEIKVGKIHIWGFSSRPHKLL